MSYHPISDIEKIKPDWYSPDSDMSYEDQKFIWENAGLTDEDEANLKQIKETEGKSVSLNRSVNGTYKNSVNPYINLSKSEVILKLRVCKASTPPRYTAQLLESLFKNYPSKPGHWLYIAQHHTPRSINRVLVQMGKQHIRGERTIQNPSSYFTSLIKNRKKRKCFRKRDDLGRTSA